MERDQIAFAADNIIGRLHGLERNIIDHLNKQYHPYGLSGMQHAFLTVVCRNPGVSQRELSNWFSLDLSNIARNVMHLEKIGYIRRERCENDKRSWLLYPTEKAEEIYPRVVDIFDKTTEQLTADMTAEEKELLSRLLNQMHRSLVEACKNEIM